MGLKKILLGFIIIVALISVFIVSTSRLTHAQGASSDSALFSKLDEILINQKAILDNLSGIKEELRVIKIRVTQSQ